MPKLKTKKSLAKRVKITKNQKMLRSHALRRHLLSGRSQKRKRLLRKKTLVDHTLYKMMKRASPYSF
ncbi:MAG: 50S ribosomal protein L35 [Candidatus Omnitrophota bacterium]